MKKITAIILAAVLLCLTILPVGAESAGVPAPVEGNPPASAAITVDGLTQLLAYCTGYAGTAGCSLKGAVRAQEVLKYCLNNQLAQTNRTALSQALSTAYDALDDEQKEELTENMEYIFGVLDEAFTGYLSVEGLLDAARVEETIRPLLRAEDAEEHYGVFKMAMLGVLGVFDELLLSCTGYAGTAGASLKNATAAYGVLNFCAEKHTAAIRPELLAEALTEAFAALDAERVQELEVNMVSIFRVLEDAFGDFEAVEELFDSAGIAENMKLLLKKEGIYSDWAVFRLQMQSMLDQIGE